MFAIALLAAQYAGTVEVLDTSTLTLRATQPAPIISTPQLKEVVIAADASTMPAARLQLSDRRWEYALGYAPSVTAADLEQGLQLQLMQAGSASISWHERFFRFMVSEAGSYGQLNAGAPYQAAAAGAATGGTRGGTGQPNAPNGPTPPVAGQPLLLNGTTFVNYGASDTSAAASLAVGRRVTVAVSGGYHVSGGLDASGQLLLPKQFGEYARLSLGVVFSRVDSLDSAVSAQDGTSIGLCAQGQQGTLVTVNGQSYPFCRERSPSLQLQETYHHALSRTENLSFTAGAAVSETQTANFQQVAVVQPIAMATYIGRFDTRGTGNLAVAAQLAPSLDIRTGLLSERIELTASLGRVVAPRVLLTFTAGMLQSIPFPVDDPYPVTSLTGAVQARIHLNPQVDVAIGGQTVWQTQSTYGTLSSEIGMVSVTARAPKLKF
jgi:hypothetical protein